MARLESELDHIGAAFHPETNELLQLTDSHDRKVAELVASEYDHFRVVYEDSDRDNPKGSTCEDSETEICGEEMTDGSLCERPADECPYH